MMLAGANDQQQQSAQPPAPPAKAAIVPVPSKDEGGLPWGWIALGVVAYLAWGYMRLLKINEERQSRRRYG